MDFEICVQRSQEKLYVSRKRSGFSVCRVAEVYQSDVSKIKLGQKVRLESTSLPGELYGKVDRIGWQIERQNVINSDPSENIDSRVVQVHVQLDEASSEKAAKFTNLQVKAVIEL